MKSTTTRLFSLRGALRRAVHPVVRLALGLAIVSYVSYGNSATAQTFPAVENVTVDPFPAGEKGQAGASATIGWTFTPQSDITVASLGWWDENQDGLLAPHDVGIWTAADPLPLVTGTVLIGTASPLDGDFRYVGISPTTLTAGEIYTIGGLTPALLDVHIRVPTMLTMHSEVSFGDGRLAFGAALAKPTLGASGSEYFGPSFQFAAVPEPSTESLLAAGGAIAALVVGLRSIAHRAQNLDLTRLSMIPLATVAIMLSLDANSAAVAQFVDGGFDHTSVSTYPYPAPTLASPWVGIGTLGTSTRVVGFGGNMIPPSAPHMAMFGFALTNQDLRPLTDNVLSQDIVADGSRLSFQWSRYSFNHLSDGGVTFQVGIEDLTLPSDVVWFDVDYAPDGSTSGSMLPWRTYEFDTFVVGRQYRIAFRGGYSATSSIPTSQAGTLIYGLDNVATAVPEPSTLASALLALVTLILGRRALAYMPLALAVGSRFSRPADDGHRRAGANHFFNL